MKTKLTAEITQLSYCVPLNEKQWQSLNAINARGDNRWDEVSEKLKKVGALDIEYNGHFGRNIFFAIESENKLKRVLVVIERIVQRKIQNLLS